MSCILVTGAAGFIGNAISRSLAADGHELILIDDFSSGRSLDAGPGTVILKGDVRDVDFLSVALPDHIESVYHCAAQSSGEVSFDDPWDDLTRHVHATFRVLEASAVRGVRTFVYLSSMAVYGEPAKTPICETDLVAPKSFYGAGKLASEAYVRLFHERGMSTRVVRPFSVYGSGQDFSNLRQGMISIYMAQMRNRGHIEVKGSLDRFRDLVHIEDAVSGIRRVGESMSADGGTFNLCTGLKVTVRELLNEILEVTGGGWRDVSLRDGTPGDQFGMLGDNTRLSQIGWKPSWSLRDGLTQMWDCR